MKTVRLLSALMLLAVVIWGCKKDNEDVNRPPSQPKLLQPAQGAVVAPDTITFTFEESIDPNDEHIDYRLYLSSDSLSWQDMRWAYPKGTDIVRVSNSNYYKSFPFELGKKYYWKIVAESKIYDYSGENISETTTGMSESSVASFYTYPSGVANLSKTSGNGFVNLTWTDPVGLSKVEITFTPAVNGITQPITVNPGVGKLELQGMENSTIYRFYVKTFNNIVPVPAVDSIKAMPLTPTLAHDADFNIYTTVQIGTQTWTRENLRTTRWQDGTGMKGYYLIGSKSSLYGYYYNVGTIDRINHGKNPCPCGYHVPSDNDMKILERFLGMSEGEINSSDFIIFRGEKENVGKILKSTSGWADYNGNSGNGTDIYGFNLLPAGYVTKSSEEYLGEEAIMWTTSGQAYGAVRIVRYYTNDHSGVRKALGGIGDYHSIRCVKY